MKSIPKGTILAAEILDRDSQHLYSGKAILSSDSLQWWFEKLSPSILDSTDTSQAYFLKVEDEKLRIQNFHRCDDPYSCHFHFQT